MVLAYAKATVTVSGRKSRDISETLNIALLHFELALHLKRIILPPRKQQPDLFPLPQASICMD